MGDNLTTLRFVMCSPHSRSFVSLLLRGENPGFLLRFARGSASACLQSNPLGKGKYYEHYLC